MKKWLAMLMAVLMLMGSASTALAEYEIQGNLMLLPNPWTDTTADGLMERTGLQFNVPEGAQKVVYRLLESQGVAECQFEWDGLMYVARIKPAFEFEDISGVMYAQWESETECTISWCEGVKKTVVDGENRVHVCLWFDIAPGLMYSLTTRTPAAQDYDIVNAAQALFVPVQDDVDGDEYALDVEYTRQMLANCTGYAGTAGSSLKAVIAACELLKYCACDIYAAQVDEGMLSYTLYQAYSLMDEEQRAEFDWNLSDIASIIESTFSGDETIVGRLDDAGMLETMTALTELENAREHWTAFYAQAVELEKLYALRQVEAAEKILKSCTGYAGTAGSSLKGAIAARGLLEYCINARVAYADEVEFMQTLKDAYARLDEERQMEFAWNMESISSLIASALEDYDRQRPLFETAGVSATMEALIQKDDALRHWNAFYGYIAEVMAE